MKSEIFYARKLFQGKVSVQSSVVEYCKRLKRKLIVDFNGDRMLVHNLDSYYCDGQSFLAHHNDKYIKMGKQYQLYDYDWRPVEKEVKVEQTIDGRFAMLEAWKRLKKKRGGADTYMKEYSTVIFYVAFIIGGISGFIQWIGYMAEALNYGNTVGFVLMLVFSEILVPLYGIIPFAIWFVILFFVGLPFYGLYKLFSNNT